MPEKKPQTDHEATLTWAQRQLGQHEEPPGSNTGRFVQACQRATWLAGTRWPWCVAFFQKAWQAGAGRKLPWLGAGAYAFLDWAKGAGWAGKIEDAVPGDAVIWNIGAGHCSMLSLPYALTRPMVATIDGNVGDKVQECHRHVSLVRGCVLVTETRVQPPPVKPPVFEVVTSASGHTKLVYASGARAVGRKLPKLLNHWGGLTIRRRKP